MKSFRTGKFKSLFRSLPPEIQEAARKSYQLWLSDSCHPSLHFKPIRGGAWSARISLNYRAVGFMRGDDIYRHWIGSHAECEKLIKGL